MFAEKDGRMILPHLLRCKGLAVCLYSGALRASHLRQTNAMQNQHMKSEVNKNPSESSDVKINDFTGRRRQQLFSEQSFDSGTLVH
jgi:hypothetical protein